MVRWRSVASACLIVALGLAVSARALQGSDELVRVFKPGRDVTSPQPIPTDFSQAISAKCPVKLSGTAELSFIVAADGTPKNLLFLHFTGTDLDWLALRLLGEQRFTAGTHDGSRVAVSQAVKIKLEGCLAVSTDASGKKHVVVRLAKAPEEKFSNYDGYPGEAVFTRRASPEQATQRWPVPPGVYRMDKGISAPVPVNSPEAQFPPQSVAKRMDAICLVSLIVNASGLPENMRMARPVNPAYDAQALDAVSRYRFKPAVRDGKEPVPVLITVEIRFRAF